MSDGDRPRGRGDAGHPPDRGDRGDAGHPPDRGDRGDRTGRGSPVDRGDPREPGDPADRRERRRPERPGERRGADGRSGPARPGRFVRMLPGVGAAVVRAAQAWLAHRAPDTHYTAGDPIEQLRAKAREGGDALLAAAIALTLCLHEETLLDEEPRVLTLRNTRPNSNWWLSRLSPSSLPPRRVGPPVRPDVFVIPDAGPGSGPASDPGPAAGR